MADFTKFILRQGVEADRMKVTYSEGEPIYITDFKRLFVGDGVTAGGNIATNKFLGIATFSSISNATGIISAYQGDLVYDTTTNNLYALTGSDPANKLSYVNLTTNYDVDNQTIFYNPTNNQISVAALSLTFNNLTNTCIGRGLEKDPTDVNKLRLSAPNDELEFRENKLGISDNGVTNEMLDTMPGNHIKGNLGSVGNVEDISLDDLADALGPILSVGDNTFGNPIGTIIDFAGLNIPNGYLECNGATYPISQFPELFQVISYTWGGSGSNFNVPDLRRKTTIGAGGSSTTTIGNAVGSVGGSENVSLTRENIPSHSHGFNAVVAGGNDGLPTAGGLAFGSSFTDDGVAGGLNAGSLGKPVNNIQPSAVVRKCIRAS